MAIKYFTDGTEYRLPAKVRTAAWLRSCMRSEGYGTSAVNFIFCSSERHREVNRQFLAHDYYTDVITFDYSDLSGREMVSGDIFIDPETVADNAVRFGVDGVEEMRRVMVHGVLHLCGYGDKTREEQETMRSKEDFYLALFESV